MILPVCSNCSHVLGFQVFSLTLFLIKHSISENVAIWNIDYQLIYIHLSTTPAFTLIPLLHVCQLHGEEGSPLSPWAPEHLPAWEWLLWYLNLIIPRYMVVGRRKCFFWRQLKRYHNLCSSLPFQKRHFLSYHIGDFFFFYKENMYFRPLGSFHCRNFHVARLLIFK